MANTISTPSVLDTARANPEFSDFAPNQQTTQTGDFFFTAENSVPANSAASLTGRSSRSVWGTSGDFVTGANLTRLSVAGATASNPVAGIVNGTAQVGFYHKGLKPSDIRNNVSPFNPAGFTSIVEKSYETLVPDGTGDKYFVTILNNAGFLTVVVTKAHFEETATNIKITWSQVDDSTAASVLNQNPAGYSDAYVKKLVEALDSMGAVEGVCGVQEYDSTTGYYQYQQFVAQKSWFSKQLVSLFGEDKLVAAALKVAYHGVGLKQLAGGRGSEGLLVSALDPESGKTREISAGT